MNNIQILKTINRSIKQYGYDETMKAFLKEDISLSELIDLDVSQEEINISLEGIISKTIDKIKKAWKARQDKKKIEREKREKKQRADKLHDEIQDSISKIYKNSYDTDTWIEFFVVSGIEELMTDIKLKEIANKKVSLLSIKEIPIFLNELNLVVEFIKSIDPATSKYVTYNPDDRDKESELESLINKFNISRKWKYYTNKGGFSAGIYASSINSGSTIKSSGYTSLKLIKPLINKLITDLDTASSLSTELNDRDTSNMNEQEEMMQEIFREEIAAFKYEDWYNDYEVISENIARPLIKLLNPEYYEKVKDYYYWK